MRQTVEFCLPDQEEKKVCPRNLVGKWVIMYFYPRDNSPGCALGAINFSRDPENFTKANTGIFGASGDSCQSI